MLFYLYTPILLCSAINLFPTMGLPNSQLPSHYLNKDDTNIIWVQDRKTTIVIFSYIPRRQTNLNQFMNYKSRAQWMHREMISYILLDRKLHVADISYSRGRMFWLLFQQVCSSVRLDARDVKRTLTRQIDLVKELKRLLISDEMKCLRKSINRSAHICIVWINAFSFELVN